MENNIMVSNTVLTGIVLLIMALGATDNIRSRLIRNGHERAGRYFFRSTMLVALFFYGWGVIAAIDRGLKAEEAKNASLYQKVWKVGFPVMAMSHGMLAYINEEGNIVTVSVPEEHKFKLISVSGSAPWDHGRLATEETWLRWDEAFKPTIETVRYTD